jgi:hypothetical protein
MITVNKTTPTATGISHEACSKPSVKQELKNLK